MRLANLAAFLLLAVTLAGCSNDADRGDSDSDGLTDAEELTGWVITVRLEGRAERWHVTSDPQVEDTDGDGMSDHLEFLLGIDPQDRDTDRDGLDDCLEARHSVSGRCQDPEAEPDGGVGTDPAKWDSAAGPSRFAQETPFFGVDGTAETPVRWGSGLGDHAMLALWTDPGPTRGGPRGDIDGDGIINVLDVDADGDGLEVGEELRYGASPADPDTDADGCRDGLDPWPAHEERYRFTLESVESNRSGEQQMRIQVVLGRTTLWIPAIDENITVAGGGRQSFNLSTEAVPLADCNAHLGISARTPWMDPVAVVVYDGEGQETLDLGPAFGRWDVRAGSHEIGTQGDRLVMAGPDGRLEGRFQVLGVPDPS